MEELLAGLAIMLEGLVEFFKAVIELVIAVL